MSASTISAAVISYETRDELRACLVALEKEAPHEVFVVDNASRDGSAEMVRCDFPWVSLIANDHNRGFGAAANQALVLATSDYVLLLNGDAAPDPGALRALANYLDEHPEAAVVGPRLVYPDGRLQPSCYPFLTPLNVLLVMSGLNGIIGSVPLLGSHHLPTSPHRVARRVPWVKGAALAVRRSVLRGLAGFDESYFLYAEEQDLCFRLATVGWQTHFAPVATISHVEGASSRGREAAVSEQIFRSLIHFYRRHYSRPRRVALRAVLALLMAGRITRDAALLARERESLKRSELRRNISVWSRVLVGRLSRPAASAP